MNGLSPLMLRSEPAGNGGAGRAGGGAGKRPFDLAAVTLVRSVSARPAIRPIPPAATATEPVTRKLRRAGCSGADGPGRRGGPAEAGRHGVTELLPSGWPGVSAPS